MDNTYTVASCKKVKDNNIYVDFINFLIRHSALLAFSLVYPYKTTFGAITSLHQYSFLIVFNLFHNFYLGSDTTLMLSKFSLLRP